MEQSYVIRKNIQRYEKLLADPMTPAETRRSVTLLLTKARKDLKGAAEEEREQKSKESTARRDPETPSTSPYLMRGTRTLWQACRDRFGWRTFSDAPCSGCALSPLCTRQRLMTRPLGCA